MHLHQIVPNSELLKQDRHDPITGEAIKAGDEVVFCAGCKSAFLKDTWTYLEGQHCGQSGTLADFPRQEELKITLKAVDVSSFKLGKVLFHLGRELPEKEASYDDLSRDLEAMIVISETFGKLFMFFYYLSLDLFHFLFPTKTRFWSLYQNGIYVGGQRPESYLPMHKSNWKLRFADISLLRLRQEKRHTWLEIILKDRRTKKITVPIGGKKALFWGLKRVATIARVELHLQSLEDLSYVRFMRNRHGARFDLVG